MVVWVQDSHYSDSTLTHYQDYTLFIDEERSGRAGEGCFSGTQGSQGPGLQSASRGARGRNCKEKGGAQGAASSLPPLLPWANLLHRTSHWSRMLLTGSTGHLGCARALQSMELGFRSSSCLHPHGSTSNSLVNRDGMECENVGISGFYTRTGYSHPFQSAAFGSSSGGPPGS